MSKSQHGHDDPQMTQNQNNRMSEDPGDGSRDAFTTGGPAPTQSPEEEAQNDPSALENFGKAGAGVAAKE